MDLLPDLQEDAGHAGVLTDGAVAAVGDVVVFDDAVQNLTSLGPALLGTAGLDPVFHILGQGRLQGQSFSSDWVAKLQPGGVEGRAGDEVRFLCAVEPVPGQGTAEGGHVDPQLVGAAGMGRELYQGEAAPCLQHPVLCEGALSAAVHLAGDDRAGGAADGQFDGPLPGDWRPGTDGEVLPEEVPGVELPLQPLVDASGLGHGHEACSPPVQTVDRVEGEAGAQIVGQAARQGGLPRGEGGGDHRQGRALVQDQKVLVLKGDVQLHGHGLHRRGPLRRVQVYGEGVPGLEDSVGENADAAHGDASLRPLQTSNTSRREAQLPTQKGADRPPVERLGDFQLQARHGTPPLLCYSDYTTAVQGFQYEESRKSGNPCRGAGCPGYGGREKRLGGGPQALFGQTFSRARIAAKIARWAG